MQVAPNPCLAVIWATTRGCGFSKDRRYIEGWSNDCLNTAKELTVPKGPAYPRLHHNPKLQQSPQMCQNDNSPLKPSETGIDEAIVNTDENLFCRNRCLIYLNAKTRKNFKTTGYYLNMRKRTWKRWFMREGNHLTDDARRPSVSCLVDFCCHKMATSTTTETKFNKQINKQIKIRN